MPEIYRGYLQVMTKIFFYDKIKNMMMPYDSHKYQGFNYIWRTAVAGSICMLTTGLLTYPFDLFHTRIAADLSKKGKSRLFTTTFDCFNRTHLDEGRKGLYKGVEICIFQSIIRGALSLPIYDFLNN